MNSPLRCSHSGLRGIEPTIDDVSDADLLAYLGCGEPDGVGIVPQYRTWVTRPAESAERDARALLCGAVARGALAGDDCYELREIVNTSQHPLRDAGEWLLDHRDRIPSGVAVGDCPVLEELGRDTFAWLLERHRNRKPPGTGIHPSTMAKAISSNSRKLPRPNWPRKSVCPPEHSTGKTTAGRTFAGC